MSQNIETFISIGLVLVLGFVIRLPIVLGRTSDGWIAFWEISQQQGRGLHCGALDAVIEGFRGYPKLQYCLISRFPRELWSVAGNVLNIGYDCLAIILVCGASKLVFSTIGVAQGRLGPNPEVWVSLLYATTTILLQMTGRLRSVKPRRLDGFFSRYTA